MKVIFMGTPDFAVPVLEKLIAEHEVVCVYTRAPKEAGRGKKISKTPVHLLAEKYGIEVRTPQSMRSDVEKEAFRALKADISIVAAYGLILPKEVIEACPKGCLNVHASLLPRWRGAAPIQRAIEAGDRESGVTIMRVVEALDAGDMYRKSEVRITSDMTGGELHDRLSEKGALLMGDVLEHLDEIRPIPQDEALVTYATKLDKAECRLNFSEDAEILERRIRAFNPFPVMFFEYEGERFKVLRATIGTQVGQTGTILSADKTLTIACGRQSLNVELIQRQGKKAMPIAELLKGYAFKAGTILHENI